MIFISYLLWTALLGMAFAGFRFRCGSNTCCSSCSIWTAQSSHTLSDFDVRSGTWSVAAGAISTSSANALAIFGGVSAPSNSMRVACAFTMTSVGDSAKIIGGYLDDNNYVYGYYERIADSGPNKQFNFKLYKREAGVETLIESTTFLNNTALAANLCVGPDKLTFSQGTGTGSVNLLTNGLPYSYGAKAGVGTGVMAGTVEFTVQNFDVHKTDNTACNQCPCLAPACASNQYPKQYELIPTAGPCAGVSCILDQSGDNNGNCEYIGAVCGIAAFAQIPVASGGNVRIDLTCTRLFGTSVTVADCATLGSGNLTTGGGFGCWSTFTIQGIPGP